MVNGELNTDVPVIEGRGSMPHDEDNTEDYGRKVRRRINKEVSRRKSAEEVSQRAQADARKARARAEELEAKLQQKEMDEEVSSVVTKAQEELEQAIEDGDTKKQAELTTKIAMASAPRRPEPKSPAATTTDIDGDNPKPAPLHESAQRFIDRNKWFTDNPKARAKAIAIESDLRENEGFDFGDDLYAEVERELLEEMPELAGDDGLDDDPGQDLALDPPRQRQAVTPRARGDVPPRRNRGEGHMTTAMQKTMITYGFNPQDPAHIKSFLKHRKG